MNDALPSRNTEMKKGILYKGVKPELVKETRRA